MWLANEPVPVVDMASRAQYAATLAQELVEAWCGPASKDLGCLVCFRELWDIIEKLRAVQHTAHTDMREYPGPFVLHEVKS